MSGGSWRDGWLKIADEDLLGLKKTESAGWNESLASPQTKMPTLTRRTQHEVLCNRAASLIDVPVCGVGDKSTLNTYAKIWVPLLWRKPWPPFAFCVMGENDLWNLALVVSFLPSCCSRAPSHSSAFHVSATGSCCLPVHSSSYCCQSSLLSRFFLKAAYLLPATYNELKGSVKPQRCKLSL